MSKQDTHFFNVFSLVIGLLVAVAVGLFALARIVASHTQDQYVLSEAGLQQERRRAHRIRSRRRPSPARTTPRSPSRREGPETAGSASAAAMPKNGTEMFEQTCSACHGQGIAGAPKAGDKAAWAPRIAKGKATLYEHALKGFQGTAGRDAAQGRTHRCAR